MKIRILSDLHLDVNRDYPFKLADKETFTILCGDTSGDPELTKEWIRNNVRHGAFVAGNHLVYNHSGRSIGELRKSMASGDTGDCTYLDCMVDGCPVVKELDERTVIVGSTMYTDFSLNLNGGSQPQDLTILRNKRLSLGCMNDYRWGLVERDDKPGTLRSLHPDDLTLGFENFMCQLKMEVEKNHKDKDIIVATHYCPSPKCIDDCYLDDDNNSSYVTDLEDFILKHKNIKLWCCGHVHHQDSFKVGDCLVVMNPRGYVGRCEDANFDRKLYVDTKDWSIHKHKKTKKEEAEFKKRSDRLLALSAWFI